MKKILCIFGLSFFLFSKSNAQSGCTDTAANNYNPSAVTNDGSCTYNVTHATASLIGALASDINECSGLTYTYKILWTHNDSGNPAQIFKIDTTDANTTQTVNIQNYPNTDWEDIADDSDYIYVGDFGNNAGDRRDLKILKIAKSDITSGSVVNLNAQAISFSYTDQTSFIASRTNNFDCESVISIGDSLYIFTKDRGDYKTREYCLPKTPGAYSISPIDSFYVDGLITGADYNPVTKEVALIGYLDGHIYSFLWFLYDYSGHHFFTGNKRRIEIGNGREWQTEGIAYDNSASRLFISCESTDSIPASLYVLDKSSFITTSVPENKMSSNISVFPNPASNSIFIRLPNSGALNVTLTDMKGEEVVCENSTNTVFLELSTNELPNGIYFLKVQMEDGSTVVKKVEIMR